MPIGDDEQQQDSFASEPRLCDVITLGIQKYSDMPHVDRGLPQIYIDMPNYKYFPLSITRKTNATPEQLTGLLSSWDNNLKNTYARAYVTDEDVIRHVQGMAPFWVDQCKKEEGEEAFRRSIKLNLQICSAVIVMAIKFQDCEPDPTDEHYPLWKEYHRLISLEIEEMIDDQCCEELSCEDDDESILYNNRIYDRYNDRIAEHRKSNEALNNKLLAAEKNIRQQAKARVSTAAARATRATTRTGRASSGQHGSSHKSGDDGDGDGDGEPPRHRTSNPPTPPLHHSLTHSLNAGGAQW
ncbi:hypothetical protein ACQUQQ_08750 [Acidithiobacillus ferrooxidans]|uniref:hypothetical protein n=1 Tax=Acidithiobacillus ferrooxidans TaxID=920 RepID=UPI000B14B286